MHFLYHIRTEVTTHQDIVTLSTLSPLTQVFTSPLVCKEARGERTITKLLFNCIITFLFFFFLPLSRHIGGNTYIPLPLLYYAKRREANVRQTNFSLIISYISLFPYLPFSLHVNGKTYIQVPLIPGVSRRENKYMLTF